MKSVDVTFSRTLTASMAPSIFDPAFSAYLDKADPLSSFRHQFSIPTKKAVGCTSTTAGACCIL
jgi:hypothetical protein